MKDKENVSLDYELMYKDELNRRKYELEEQATHFREELNKERNTKNAIIEQQAKEIEFLKNIIKGILHF